MSFDKICQRDQTRVMEPPKPGSRLSQLLCTNASLGHWRTGESLVAHQVWSISQTEGMKRKKLLWHITNDFSIRKLPFKWQSNRRAFIFYVYVRHWAVISVIANEWNLHSQFYANYAWGDKTTNATLSLKRFLGPILWHVRSYVY